MTRFFRFFFVALLATVPALAQQPLAPQMRQAAQAFLKSLTDEQRKTATFAFTDEERFNWHFVPRERKGLTFNQMTEPQRKTALALLHTALSDQGYGEAAAIFDLENVLRVVENRPPNDTRRDPGNYAFSVFGEPTEAGPWGWRVEGHHLSLNFSSLTNRIVAVTPTFFGSNPGIVRAEVPQKGKEVLKREAELGYALVNSLSDDQLKKATLSDVAPGDIVTYNKRKALLEKQEGIAFGDLGRDQQQAFLRLLDAYLQRYHLTLANQQMDKLKQAGLDKLTFAWAGDRQPGLGPGKGQYYRIHGPTILIEYDNTQNEANHVHTVVRDLTNDFGDDVLAEHYRQQHK